MWLRGFPGAPGGTVFTTACQGETFGHRIASSLQRLSLEGYAAVNKRHRGCYDQSCPVRCGAAQMSFYPWYINTIERKTRLQAYRLGNSYNVSYTGSHRQANFFDKLTAC